MATDIPDDEREEIKLTLDVILLALDWNRKTFASKTGINRSNVSKIANGKRRAQPRTWRKIETGTRLPLAEVKAVVPLIRRLRALAAGRLPPARRPAVAASLARTVGAAVEAALQREAPPVPPPVVPRVEVPATRPAAADRELAAELWERLRGRDQSARLALGEETPKYQTWALAERLCHESVATAADDPKEAVHLAMLALRLVEALSGEPAWLCLLAGYVWAFVGNARRVDSDLPGAEEAFRRRLGSLEGGLYLERGRTAEVKELVAAMETVFRAQGVHEEAQKALALFRRAVEMETVTLVLVRRLVAFLYRAQHDPELRFEGER
jgi:transcriptional regulator with XRE-family HTH domain